MCFATFHFNFKLFKLFKNLKFDEKNEDQFLLSWAISHRTHLKKVQNNIQP